MTILLVGLNHRTATVALREQLALATCGVRMALDDLTKPASNNRVSRYLSEAVILSTCNRLEVYAVCNADVTTGWDTVEHFLAKLQGVTRSRLHPHLYFKEGMEAVVHLMRVAAGLDSMILGEPQILGQVSNAQREAHRQGAIGPVLSHLFDLAVHTGKRARTETEIGRHTTSVSHVAAQFVRERLGDLDKANVLIVGAGEIAEVAAHALQAYGASQLNFINRTYSRAENLANQFQSRALNWYHLPAALTMADVVVTATGAPHIVIHASDVRPIILERAGRPLLFVDIAVPRDVEEVVGELAGVERYDIDHFQMTVDANLAQRQAAVPEVEQIVGQEAGRFEDWLSGRQVLPVLVELRRKAKDIASSEMARSIGQLEELDPDQRERISTMVHRIVNKLLHEPTVRLKASAADGNGVAYAHVLRELFDLEVSGPAMKPAIPVNGDRTRINGAVETNKVPPFDPQQPVERREKAG